MNLNFILITVFSLLCLILSKSQYVNAKRTYIILCTIILMFFSATCSIFYGVQNGYDSYVYCDYFTNDRQLSFNEIFDKFVARYFYHEENEFDIGFVLLEWSIGQITSNYHIYKFIVSLIVFIPFGMLVSHYSENLVQVCFAYIFFVTFIYQGILIGGRQVFAIGMCICFFFYYSQKKYKKAILFLALAIILHMSSLLILIPFALSFLPDKSLKIISGISIILIPIIAFMANPIMAFMGNFIGMEKYATYGMGILGKGALTFIMLASLLSIYCIAVVRNDYFENKQIKNLYCMLIAFTLTFPLVFSNGSAMRISQYFMTFLSVLIPVLTYLHFSQKANTYLAIMIVVLYFFSFSRGYVPYEFCWNDPVTYRF